MKTKLRIFTVAIATFVTVSVGAQVIDGSYPIDPITGRQIVFVDAKLNNEDETGLYNNIITLSNSPMTAFNIAQVMIRFNNQPSTSTGYNGQNPDSVIDLRNGAAYQTMTNKVKFLAGDEFFIWIDVNFPTQTYTTWVQKKGTADAVMIYENAAFRPNTVVTQLSIVSTIHDATSGNSVEIIGDPTFVDAVVPVPVSVKNESVASVSVYPNPAQNEIKIAGLENVAKIEIFSIIGNKVLSVSNPSEIIDISSLEQGVYAVKLTLTNGNVSNQVIIKK
jgi:hypothetical protein